MVALALSLFVGWPADANAGRALPPLAVRAAHRRDRTKRWRDALHPQPHPTCRRTGSLSYVSSRRRRYQRS